MTQTSGFDSSREPGHNRELFAVECEREGEAETAALLRSSSELFMFGDLRAALRAMARAREEAREECLAARDSSSHAERHDPVEGHGPEDGRAAVRRHGIAQNQSNTARDALTKAAEARAKPLFWRKPTDHPQDRETASWVANGIGGQYSIEPQRDGTFLLWWAHDNFIWEKCETIKEAKTKADADWQKRFAERLLQSTPCSVENGGWLGPQLSAKASALSTLVGAKTYEMGVEDAAKVAAAHKPTRTRPLSHYEPEDRAEIKTEERGEAIAAQIIAANIRALTHTAEHDDGRGM